MSNTDLLSQDEIDALLDGVDNGAVQVVQIHAALDDSDRKRLLRRLPGIEHDPASYGAFARRNLSASEAAILMHNAA